MAVGGTMTGGGSATWASRWGLRRMGDGSGSRGWGIEELGFSFFMAHLLCQLSLYC